MADEENNQRFVLSREELYSQVWATPMSRLATQGA
jgi:hypothetical protein